MNKEVTNNSSNQVVLFTQANKQENSINTLPQELILSIFAFIFDGPESRQDIVNIKRVKKQWCLLANQIDAPLLLKRLANGENPPISLYTNFISTKNRVLFENEWIKNKILSIPNKEKIKNIIECDHLQGMKPHRWLVETMSTHISKHEFNPDSLKNSKLEVFKQVVKDETQILESLKPLDMSKPVPGEKIQEVVILMASFFRKYPEVTWDDEYKIKLFEQFFEVLHDSIPYGPMTLGNEQDPDLMFVYLTLVCKTKRQGLFCDHRYNMFPEGSVLLQNREILLAAAKGNGMLLGYASIQYRNDPEIVGAAVGQWGEALQYASNELKNDLTIVTKAVKQEPVSVRFAGAELQNNKEIYKKICLTAVSMNGVVLNYISKELLEDEDVVLAAATKDGRALKGIYDSTNLEAKKMLGNMKIVSAAVSSWGASLEYADQALKDDRGIVENAVKSIGWAIKFANKKYQNDKPIALLAVKNNIQAFECLSYSLRGDPDVVELALKDSGLSVRTRHI